MADIMNIGDAELENKLKQYSAMKKARDLMMNQMVDNFTETDDETIIVNQVDADFEPLIIEEDDD